MNSDNRHAARDVSVISYPERWSVKALRELILQFLNGGTPDTSNPAYWDGAVPWITGADAEKRITTSSRDYITKQEVEESSTNIVPKGNILLVTRTGVGKVSIAGVDVAISQDLTGLIPDLNSVDVNYLYRQLAFFGPYLRRYAQGTVIQGIERTEVERLLMPFPEKPEQRRIAYVLDTIDEAIAKTEAVIAKLKQVCAGLLHDLLTRGLGENGELRDPIAHPEQFHQHIPRSWERTLCDRAFSLASGTSTTQQELERENPGCIPVYGGNGIVGYTTIPLLHHETIVIGRVGEYCGKVHHVTGPAWITDNALYATRFASGFNVSFVYRLLQWFDLSRLQSQTGQPLLPKLLSEK